MDGHRTAMGILLPSRQSNPSAFLHHTVKGAQSQGSQYPMPTLRKLDHRQLIATVQTRSLIKNAKIQVSENLEE